MKYIGALFIMCGCIVLSYFYECNERSKLSHLVKMRDFINHIKVKIDYFLTPCHQLFSEYDDEFIKNLAVNNFDNINDYYYDPILSDISHFFANLGNGLKDEQISLCDYVIQKLDDSIKKVEGEIKDKIKIFRTLTLFGGGSLVILMI